MHPSPQSNEQPRQITPALLADWPLPSLEGDKAKRGQGLVIAGAVEMPGGAVLTGTAALRAGAGVVQVATAESAVPAVATAVPELYVIGITSDGEHRQASLRTVVELAKLADVVLIGPGMRDAEAIRSLLPELLGMDHLDALIIDAKAIAIAAEFLPAKGKLRGKTILTPQASETEELTKTSAEETERDPLRVAREAARRLGSVILLKQGPKVLICGADGPAYLNTGGNVGLDTAGSGDVLAGMIAGLCARGAEPLQAAVYGASAIARAGEKLAQQIGPVGYLARELLPEIPRLLAP